MKGGRWQFRPRGIPTLAAILMVALTSYLGIWQVGRAHEKQALQERFDAMGHEPAVTLPAAPVQLEEFLYRKVSVRGRFDPRYQIFLDNQTLNGVVGYHVVAPLRIGSSDQYVLINRGWVPRTSDRRVLPEVPPPSGEITVEGVVASPHGRFFELSSETVEGPIWQNLVMERYASMVPFSLQPVLILQTSATPDALKRQWPRPDTGQAMHWGYAFQWFAMAAAIIIIYIVVNTKRVKH